MQVIESGRRLQRAQLRSTQWWAARPFQSEMVAVGLRALCGGWLNYQAFPSHSRLLIQGFVWKWCAELLGILWLSEIHNCIPNIAALFWVARDVEEVKLALEATLNQFGHEHLLGVVRRQLLHHECHRGLSMPDSQTQGPRGCGRDVCTHGGG